MAALEDRFLRDGDSDEPSANAFNYSWTFYYMIKRRLERQFKGVYAGPSKVMSWLAYLVWAYAFVVVALTGVTSLGSPTKNAIHVSLLVFCALIAVLVVAQHLRNRLLLLLVYSVVVAHATFFAVTGDADLVPLVSETTKTKPIHSKQQHRTTVLIILGTVDAAIVVLYGSLFYLYPLLLTKGYVNVATWFDVARGRRANTLTYRTVALHKLWASQNKFTIQYTGGLDKAFRPHGFGVWKDTSFHGETLVGAWEHGIPVGPFTSREHGSGYATQQVRVAYAYYRSENPNDAADWFPKLPADQQLRYGVASTEVSVAGGFFTFLPRVSHFFDRGNAPQSAKECLQTLRTPLDNVFYRDTESHEIVSDHSACASSYRESLIPTTLSLFNNRKATTSPHHHQPEKEAFVWIHGINTSLTEAVKSCTRVLAMGDFPSQIHPFVFSWASGSVNFPSYWTVKKYADSQEIANALSQFVKSLVVDAGYTKVHFLTHSMGTRVFLNTVERNGFKEIFASTGTWNSTNAKPTATMESVTFCSPEFPLQRFVKASGAFDVLREYSPKVVTMFGDKWDVALRGSEFANKDRVFLLCGPRVRALGCSVTRIVREPSFPLARDCVYVSAGAFDISSDPSEANAIVAVNHTAGFRHVAGVALSNHSTASNGDTSQQQPPWSYGSIADYDDDDQDNAQATPLVYLDMDVVDTSFTDNNVGNNRHSYFTLTESIVEDIREIILHKRRAKSRAGLMRQKGNVYIFLRAPKDIV